MKSPGIVTRVLRHILTFLVLASTSLTLAQTSPEGHYRTDAGQIVINLKSCSQDPCILQHLYARVSVSGGIIMAGRAGLAPAGNTPLKITSNLPIQQLGGALSLKPEWVQKGNRKASVSMCQGTAHWVDIGPRNENIVELSFSAGTGPYCYFGDVRITHLVLNVGSSVSISEDMKNAAVSLIAAYQGISEHLEDFRQIVARDSSDARHLTRLVAQLKSTLKMMVDEKGNPLLPVTHRKVTESSRMIMVLSTVLEEMMDKYDFNSRILEPLKPAKEALTALSRQIRMAYGWEEGLAGSGSKALASLSSILDTELRNMYSLMSAFNNDPQVIQTFNTIFRANSALFNRVNASNAGDVAGAGLARELLGHWNSPQFQSILSTMMNAPKESQASLQNRILMALTAVESIKDYVDPKGDGRINVEVPANVRSKLN